MGLFKNRFIRLKPLEQEIPESETWEFQPGQKVSVIGKELSGVWCLVATIKPPRDPKYWFKGVRTGPVSSGFVPVTYKGGFLLLLIFGIFLLTGYLFEKPIVGFEWLSIVSFLAVFGGIGLMAYKTDRSET